jgi:hypothetical protein
MIQPLKEGTVLTKFIEFPEEEYISGVCILPDGSMVVVPDTGDVYRLIWAEDVVLCTRVKSDEGMIPVYLSPGWSYGVYRDVKGASGRCDHRIFPQSADRARKHIRKHKEIEAVIIEIGTSGPGEIPTVGLAYPEKNQLAA